jgi:hypothetical protein
LSVINGAEKALIILSFFKILLKSECAGKSFSRRKKMTDAETTPYASGGISIGMWTDSKAYAMSVDDVIVNSLPGGRSAPQVPSQPEIESVVLTDGIAAITWSAIKGGTYQVQYKDDLSATNWNELSTTVSANGGTATATNAVGNVPQRFYRVLLLQ